MDMANRSVAAAIMQQTLAASSIGMAMVKQAAQQEAAVLQMVAAAVAPAPRPGNAERLDITV